MREVWKVKCMECGAEHTEVYPGGLTGSSSHSDPSDPSRCDCEDRQYSLLQRLYPPPPRGKDETVQEYRNRSDPRARR